MRYNWQKAQDCEDFYTKEMCISVIVGFIPAAIILLPQTWPAILKKMAKRCQMLQTDEIKNKAYRRKCHFVKFNAQRNYACQ